MGSVCVVGGGGVCGGRCVEAVCGSVRVVGGGGWECVCGGRGNIYNGGYVLHDCNDVEGADHTNKKLSMYIENVEIIDLLAWEIVN